MERDEDRILMSQYERDLLKIMAPVLQSKRTQAEAARLLKLSERQVRRIQRRLERDGDGGVVHGLRGKASNHRLAEDLRETVVTKYRDHFGDFVGCWRRGCGSRADNASSIVSVGLGARVSVSWCRWMHRCTNGWKAAARTCC